MFFSSKWLYVSARGVRSLSRILAMRSSDVRAVNFAGATSPTSLFGFPVTCAHSLFPASASKRSYQTFLYKLCLEPPWGWLQRRHHSLFQRRAAIKQAESYASDAVGYHEGTRCKSFRVHRFECGRDLPSHAGDRRFRSQACYGMAHIQYRPLER